MKDISSSVQQGKRLLSKGSTQGEILDFLSRSGHTISEAIIAIREIYSIDLQESKEICAASVYWKDIVEAARPLHDDFEKHFSK